MSFIVGIEQNVTFFIFIYMYTIILVSIILFLACGGVLQSDRGEITTPNYPNNYDHDLGCAWEIVADEGLQIEVT